MNAKIAKELRKAAGYRNQSATPGAVPFPGVAKVYNRPVYTTRPAFSTTYEPHPSIRGKVVRVTHKRTAMNVMGRKGLEQYIPLALEEKIDPKTGASFYGPVFEMVPVAKPAKLGALADGTRAEKKVYRDLKKLLRSGALSDPHAYDTFVGGAQ